MISIASGSIDTLLPTILYANGLASGTLAASGSTAGTYPENILGPQTYDGWKADALPATLTATFGTTQQFDACAIAAHTLGTSGATLYVERWTGSAWATVASVSPTDDSPVLLIWPAATATQWRLRITGTTVPFIGLAMMGQRLLFPAQVRTSYVPLNAAKRLEILGARSISGQFLGSRILRKGLEASVGLSPLAASWAETNLPAFMAHYDSGLPFFWASSPARYASDVGLVWRNGGELRPAYTAGGLYVEIAMELAGHA